MTRRHRREKNLCPSLPLLAALALGVLAFGAVPSAGEPPTIGLEPTKWPPARTPPIQTVQPDVPPCTPCQLDEQPDRWILDLSQTEALPPGLQLDEIYLLVAEAAYRLVIDDRLRSQYTAGKVDQLVIARPKEPVEPGATKTLYFRIATDEGAVWYSVSVSDSAGGV